MTIAAVILAAGMATRMGNVKQLLPWGTSTILGSTIDLYTKAHINKIIVVVGYCAREIMDRLQDKPVQWVVNQEYQSGMASSLRAGIKALSEADKICLLALGDTPFISPETISKIVQAEHIHQAKIVVPFYKQRQGHPILMTSKMFPELLKVTGDVGARSVIKAYADLVYKLEVDDEGVIMDIDTAESYLANYDKYGRGL